MALEGTLRRKKLQDRLPQAVQWKLGSGYLTAKGFEVQAAGAQRLKIRIFHQPIKKNLLQSFLNNSNCKSQLMAFMYNDNFYMKLV